MPANKNQHYTPRCHFRPFSVDQEGLAINLLNIASQRPIHNASISGQCAGAYFYGRDQIVENYLRTLEGRYAKAVSQIQDDISSATWEDLKFLREFVFLQNLRTESSIKRQSMIEHANRSAVFREHYERQPTMSHAQHVKIAMRAFLEARKYLEDLKCCILINRTPDEFVTSDDPAILTNRLYIQRIGATNFGVINSGALFLMPLTPRHLFLAYDSQSYTLPDRTGFTCDLARSSDVTAINWLQYLYCAQNLYFSDWESRHRIATEYTQASSARVAQRYASKILIQTGSGPYLERYREATDNELDGEGPFIVANEARYPRPTNWPTVLKFRNSVKTYTNGTAIGHVRNRTWLNGID